MFSNKKQLLKSFFLLVFILSVSTSTAWSQQFARPASDDQVTGWTRSSTVSPPPYYEHIDETSANDGGDYLIDNTPDNTQRLITSLTSVTDPSSSSNHIVRMRVAKSASDGRTINFHWWLTQGATVRASGSANGIAGPWGTNISYTLTGTEADSITNYGDLEFEYVFEESGGGQPRSGWLTWAEFEVPSAAGGSPRRAIQIN